MKKLLFLLLTVLYILTSCDEEFDLFSSELDLVEDWQETVGVYANINSTDNIHYVRINRGFAGNNFFLANTNPDSIYFNPTDVQVTLYKLRVNSMFDGEILSADTLGAFVCKDTLIPKDTSGMFSTEFVPVFYTQTKEFSVSNSEDLYLGLEVITPRKIITSHTKIIERPRFDYPNTYLPRFPIEKNTFDVKLRLPISSQIYRVEGYCSYYEITRIDGIRDTTLRTFSFLMGTYQAFQPLTVSGEIHHWRESTELFYGGLERDVLKNGDTINTITRMLDGIYFKTYIGNADLAMVFSGISIFSGYSTEPTIYTNIHEGLGYLTSYAEKNTQKYFFTYPTEDSVISAYGYKYHFVKNYDNNN